MAKQDPLNKPPQQRDPESGDENMIRGGEDTGNLAEDEDTDDDLDEEDDLEDEEDAAEGSF